MNRRPLKFATTLAAALALTQIVPSASVRADPLPANGTGVATYELTSSSTLPAPAANATSPQVVLDVTNGQIVPPTNSSGVTSSPLTILNSSSGLDQNNLVVGLKNVTPTTSGGPTQEFGLSFYQTGLLSASAGGHLDFQLTVNPSLPTPTLTSEMPGITVTSLSVTPTPPPPSPPAVTTPSTNQTSGTQVPEPASLAFWSVVVGLGALRARAYRRSH